MYIQRPLLKLRNIYFSLLSIAGFYKSSGTPLAEPFLPSSSPRTYFSSARRNLAVDLENQQGQKDADDFKPSPNYKQFSTQQRLPLTDLSKQKGSALRALLMDSGEDVEGYDSFINYCREKEGVVLYLACVLLLSCLAVYNTIWLVFGKSWFLIVEYFPLLLLLTIMQQQ